MFPYFVIFGKIITLYMVMAIVGILASGLLACSVAKKRGFDDNDMIIVLLCSAAGVLVGGHVLYGITNIKYIPALFHAESIMQFFQFVGMIFGGSVFYGGLIGGIIAALIAIKTMKLPLGAFADIITMCIPLFHAFARIGCFLSGCCYGIESEFGFTAHGNTLVPDVNDVSRFPVQLLEAGLNLLLFALLVFLYKKISGKGGFFDGKLIFIYLICYSIIRFSDEFLRGDAIRGFVFGTLSTSQFISIILFVGSSVILAFKYLRKTKNQ